MKTFTLYVRQLSLVLLGVFLSMFSTIEQLSIFTYQSKLPDNCGKWNQLSLQSQEVPAELCAAIEVAAYSMERDEMAPVGSGYLAPNPAQGWHARFDSDGLSVEVPALSGGEVRNWAMRLVSYGYGERAVPVEAAEVAAAGNRVEYRRGPLVEWYVNERRGVEQGFTISEPPVVADKRTQGAPLSLRLTVEGDLHAELSADGQSIGFMDESGQRQLLYDKLVAFDALGHELPSRMRVEGSKVVLEVEDAGASYPLTVDPLIQQQKLTASDTAASDIFGHSVSLSGDTVIVGAYQDDNSGGVDAGAAYVFTRSGGVWTQQQKLTASDAATGDNFGFSVSVSGDTVIVGAIRANNSGGQDAGAAYIFTRSGGVWTQQQRIQASDGALNDLFGYSVSVSGSTAVISSVADDNGGDGAGSAYIFTHSGSVWTEQQRLQASDAAAGDNFGHSVSLSSDTVIISAWQDDHSGWNAAGSAYIFIRSSGVWMQQQKLTASDAAPNDFFGVSVSLSGDTTIIGTHTNSGGTDTGAAYVFTRSSGVWTQQQRIQASDIAEGDSFGHCVSVSGDTAVVSALLDDDGGVDAGSAYVFTRSGGVWTQQQKFQASDAAAGDSFGISVSLSGDTVIVGAYQDDNSGGVDAGAAYVFVLNTTSAAPVVNAGPDQSTTEDSTFNLSASFTDADASDIHTATVNWGDGSPTEAATVTEPSGPNPGTITASHTYLTPGNYTVTVTVTDSANSSGTDTLQVAVGPADLSASYIRNTTTQQANANFNISGNGVIAGNLLVNGALTASGSGLTDLNASNITTGTLDNTRLGVISAANIADSAITAPKIADFAVTAVKIGSNQVVKNLNGLTDSVNLAAGANVTITPSGNTLTISAAGGNFIQNTTTQQSSSNFNISGNGTAGGTLSGSILNATIQFNISGNRVLSVAGTANTFAGTGAGNSNTTGFGNAFVGTNAGYSNATSIYNSFFGYNAGYSNTTGNDNAFFGTAAGYNNTTGLQNAFFGRSAGYSNTTGIVNSFFGYSAGFYNTEGNSNSFFGQGAGFSNITGSGNSLVGASAGFYNTTGFNNSFVGVSAGYNNTTGYNNAFFGAQAGYSTTTSINNSFFGTAAGYNSTGAQNAFFGTSAGQSNTTGSDNAFVGMNAGYNTTTGSQNVLFGRSTGFYNTTGNYNVFLGMSAGLGNTTGSSNTVIGAAANVGANNLTYATALGAEATVSTSNTVALGRSAGQDTVLIPGMLQLNLLGGAGSNHLCRNASNQIATCSSSLRYKTNVAPFTAGLSLVRRLRPITFIWKDGGMADLGFGAEDVAKINPLFVIYNDKGQVEGVKYDRLSVAFVNAFKEQQAQIEAQQTQLKQHQSHIEAQRQQLKQQQILIDGLKKLLCKKDPDADICR